MFYFRQFDAHSPQLNLVINSSKKLDDAIFPEACKIARFVESR